MRNRRQSSVSRLGRLPRVAVANTALALLALPVLSALNRFSLLGLGRLDQIAVQWVIAAAVVGIAVGIEDRSLAEIGFRRPAWRDLGYLLLTAVAALLVFAGTDPLVSATGLPVADDAGTMAVSAGIGVALLGALTTGVVEEVLFRGYPLERLLDYSERPFVAGGLTWGVFTVAHVAVWPLGNLVQIAAVAALFTVVYLRRRTLVPVIGAHVLVWGLSVLGQVYG
ncbi:CPBP family intramembrane glutamic endopeptidase [Halomicroarcula sp. GCM10025709]|uniref:CPBP family intramembrane glutamic endopeptidase n=1 Tax=Haloarcula TaxID=2237 RepID=UPI0024C469A9|nr:CPBP family intramembrane metalloprotease [Halomicroarcula sp. YJ-61-S]